MRVIALRRLREYMQSYPDAKTALTAWHAVTKTSWWTDLQQVRRNFPTADGVVVRSRRVATVFNIRGNKYRLVTAIHYDKGKVFVLRFLTHAEYSKGSWKETL